MTESLQDFNQIILESIKQVEESVLDKLAQDIWQRHTDCQPVTDLLSESIINQYFAIWKHEQELLAANAGKDGIKTYLDHISLLETIGENLHAKLCDLHGFGIEEHDEKLMQSIIRLRDLIQSEIDDVTLKVLEGSLDAEKKESQPGLVSFSTLKNKVYLWNNNRKDTHHETLSFDNGNIVVNTPKALRDRRIVMRITVSSSSISSVLYSTNDIFGSVLNIELFESPETIVTSDGWSIRQVQTLEKAIYPRPEDSVDLHKAAFNVIYKIDKIPKSAAILAFKNAKWSPEGLDQADISRGTGQVSFNTYQSLPFAVITQATGEVTSWNLKPVELINQSLLTIEHESYGKMEILISEQGCKLVSPTVSDALNGQFSGANLFINLLMQNGYRFKKSKCDDKLLWVLALAPYNVEFSFSRDINKQLNSKFLIWVRETAQDSEWYTIMFNSKYDVMGDSFSFAFITKGKVDMGYFVPGLVPYGTLHQALMAIITSKPTSKPLDSIITLKSLLTDCNTLTCEIVF